jgi:hypothetical protein
MDRKLFLTAGVAVAIIVAIIVAGLWFGHWGAGFGSATPDPNVAAPGGSVTAVASSSISIQPREGAQKTFSISSTTDIISQVSSGEVGLGLADIKIGDTVVIRPKASSADEAASIEIFSLPEAPQAEPDPSAPAASGPPVSFTGSVLTVSPSLLTVAPDGGGDDIRVAITKRTAVRSNVLAGQKGKTFDDITAGSKVFVAGTAGSNGVIANTVQVLTAIYPQAP